MGLLFSRPGTSSGPARTTAVPSRLPGRSAAVLCLVGQAWLATGLFGQGSLTPPGTPAPTMRTLDQVEPRLIVNAANCPGDSSNAFIISVAGSYYLTGNIVAINTNGINIKAVGGVTLDLNGYTISSIGSTTGLSGIVASGNSANLTVRHGYVRGTTTLSGSTFTSGGFSYGVQLGSGANCRVEDVAVSGIGNTGIEVDGTGGIIARCQADTVASLGIQIPGGVVEHCTAQNCDSAIRGQMVDSCTGIAVGSVSGYGITGGSMVSNSKGVGGGGNGISGGTVINCTGQSKGSGFGISAQEATNCDGSSYSGTAVSVASTATNCSGVVTSGSGAGISANTATNCNGTSDSGAGLFVATATGCYGMTGSGVAINATVALNCNAYGASGTGLFCTMATNCQASNYANTANAVAMNVSGTANSCYATTGGNIGYSLKAAIAIGCTLGTGTTQIANKYNMP